MTTLALAYGFEYDLIIPARGETIICKSPTTGNPIYCTAIILDTNVHQMIQMMRSCKMRTHQLHTPIIRLLDKRCMYKTTSGDLEKTIPKWQLVLYNKSNHKLGFTVNIEGSKV